MPHKDGKHKRNYKQAVKMASGKRVPASQGKTGEKYNPRAQGTIGGVKTKEKTVKRLSVTAYKPSKMTAAKEGPTAMQKKYGSSSPTKKEFKAQEGGAAYRKGKKEGKITEKKFVAITPKSKKPKVKRANKY